MPALPLCSFAHGHRCWPPSSLLSLAPSPASLPATCAVSASATLWCEQASYAEARLPRWASLPPPLSQCACSPSSNSLSSLNNRIFSVPSRRARNSTTTAVTGTCPTTSSPRRVDSSSCCAKPPPLPPLPPLLHSGWEQRAPEPDMLVPILLARTHNARESVSCVVGRPCRCSARARSWAATTAL